MPQAVFNQYMFSMTDTWLAEPDHAERARVMMTCGYGWGENSGDDEYPLMHSL